MTPDHNNHSRNNELQWDSGNLATAQTTPEDPIPATSYERAESSSTMNGTVAGRPPLYSTIKREEQSAAAAGFPFFPGAFHPAQWWTPNVPFTMDDQPWTNGHFNPFSTVGASTTQHPFDPFPSTSNAGSSEGFPSAMATTRANAFPSYDIITPNIGYFPTMSFSTAAMTKTSPTNTIASSTPNLPENLPYKTGRGTNDVRVRTADNYRRVYTDYIRLELEKEYHMSQFITPARKADLAEKLNLTERQIKIWFQNRRAKKRKEDPR